MGEDRRLAALQAAHRAFVTCVESLTPEQFLTKMDQESPRDLAARLAGWNRLTALGCRSLLEGKSPAYHADFADGYRRVNSELIARLPAADRGPLLEELNRAQAEALAVFREIQPDVWNADRGVRHPDGGPATVRRCLEELSRSYMDSTDEITVWLETTSGPATA